MERRRYKRYLKAIPLSYEIELDGEWGPGEGQLITMDLSAGGARVRCNREVLVGQRLALSMDLEGFHFCPVATVVWVSPSRVDGCVIAGVEFEDVDDAARDRVGERLEQTAEGG